MRLCLILGDNLYPSQPKADATVMIESWELCTHYKYHKHKIILFLAAMRACGADYYYKLSKKTFASQLLDCVKKTKATELVTYTIEDKFMHNLIVAFCKKHKVKLIIEDSPGFLTTIEKFSAWKGDKNPIMQQFYIWQRKRLDILVENSSPVGGKWSFDEDNRKKLPKDIKIPKLSELKETPQLKEVKALVEKEFASHPGSVDTFFLPTTRKQALGWLDDFFKHRFDLFGPYEDAISTTEHAIFHSLLSPLLNLGLLTPKEVIEKALKKNVGINSLEGFVRQVIGWREFVRGMYHTTDFYMNQLGHKRKLTKHWYGGTTGILPLDTVIKRVNKYAYAHHIERLMVVGNLMLLCEIDPDEVYKWFMELFVDSADWVMAPNVYGMSQFALNSFATKPYICGSNYIRKMSDYKKEDWCDIMDGLYWRFVEKHRKLFESNPRMAMMVKSFDRMEKEKRDRILSIAEDTIKKITM